MSADRSLLIVVLALTACGAMQPAAAQTIAKPATEAKAAADTKAAEAAKAFEAGTKAFENGRTDAAVAALSTAIMSGGLKNPELAKAFFYRGVAQRTQKKPGAALSDLNAAVWLRDGLSATDKAVAEDHRQALFREIAEKSGAPPSMAAAPAANPVPAVTPAPAAAVEPASPPAVAEPQTPSTPTWPWSAAAPAPPAAVPAAERAKEAPPIPRAQEFVNTTPPAVEKPLPWTTATDAEKPQPAPQPEPPSAAAATAAASTAAAPMLLDTIVEPVASVAAVERGNIAPVHAEPAPPEKPLPWATASAAPENGQPEPWTADAKPVQTFSASPAGAVAPQPAPPEAAPRTAEPVASVPVSAPAADPVPITESVGNAASAASDTLAGAGQAATQFIGSLFGGSSSAPPEVAEANTAPPQSAPQADAVNGDSGAQPMPRAWPTETNAATQAARVETAAISKPVEVAVREEAPAWTSQTRATPAAAPFNPPVIATAQPLSVQPYSGNAAASTSSASSVAAANSTQDAVVPRNAVLPGPYRLQISAENTREDAEQTLARLVAKHRPSLKGLEPVVEEPQTGNVLFGSMGAAYRVSVGPYVTSVEPGRLCNILQPHGFDCRVVAVTP